MNTREALKYIMNMMISEFVNYDPICDDNLDVVGFEEAILKLTHYIMKIQRDFYYEDRIIDNKNENFEEK